MLYLRLKRKKIGTALTITASQQDADSVSQWGQTMPRVICMGTHQPANFLGLRYNPTPANYPIKKLLGNYIQQIPGLEVVILSAPSLKIGGRQQDLLKYVDAMAYDMAWGCNCETPHGERLFVLSSAVIPHIINDMTDKVTLEGRQWSDNLHAWLKLTLVHRYFDGTQYGIAESPILNAYDLTPEPPPATPEPAPEPILSQIADPVEAEIHPVEKKAVKRKGRKPKK